MPESAENRPTSGLVTLHPGPATGVALACRGQAGDSHEDPSERSSTRCTWFPTWTSFLEVIATWDERSFFPILIDDPAYTLPFLRAFRPARVVRIVGSTPGPANAR